MTLDYLTAKKEFLNGNYQVEKFFKSNNFTLEYAYCQFFKGDLSNAIKEFQKISDTDIRADWAIKLIDIINHNIKSFPSYLQVRNFLEVDINLLLLAKKPEYIEEIINSSDFLYSINNEAYKLIGRTMFNNEFLDIALFYLLKAKNNFFKDPETHFLLATCYLQKGTNDLAIKSLKNCLDILPNYLPAQKLLKKISA
ncbi:MAG: hypothetical protein MJ229_06140 [bacterium]|nr:hypothetical protein [bacterium]